MEDATCCLLLVPTCLSWNSFDKKLSIRIAGEKPENICTPRNVFLDDEFMRMYRLVLREQAHICNTHNCNICNYVFDL